MMIGFLPDLTFFFGHPPRMMIEFLTHLSFSHFLFGSHAKNDDRIPDLTFFFGHPPRMMIGFLSSLSFWVTRQE
jgi:hypothetical protein